MISELIRAQGPSVWDRIEFKVQPNGPSQIEIVVEYSQLGKDDAP
jgi:hypothetical protein